MPSALMILCAFSPYSHQFRLSVFLLSFPSVCNLILTLALAWHCCSQHCLPHLFFFFLFLFLYLLSLTMCIQSLFSPVQALSFPSQFSLCVWSHSDTCVTVALLSTTLSSSLVLFLFLFLYLLSLGWLISQPLPLLQWACKWVGQRDKSKYNGQVLL
jgi:hypothetical protein